MNSPTRSVASAIQTPTKVRYGVLAFVCSLSMITYLDRVCFGTIAPLVKEEFGLSESQKGNLFAAFALAYALFEVPSGWLGDLFGPRRTLIRIVLWWSLFTALTGCIWNFTLDSGYRLPVPFTEREIPLLLNGFLLMLMVRFLFGMGEAGAYPNIARALYNWFPFSERGLAQGGVWMAGRLAGGLTPLVVGVLFLLFQTKTPEGHTITHWRYSFWVLGVIGVMWCLAFAWWFRDRPEQRAGVNQAEIDLIRGGEGSPQVGHAHIPWRQLLTSVNLWSLCLMYFCAAYGWYFNITWLPGLLKDHFRLDPEKQFWTFSILAGAPLLVGSVGCILGGLLTDAFIRWTGNRKWGRRLFGFIGHAICAACCFAAIFAHQPWLFVLAIGMAAFWNDLTMGATWAICLDIGKRYSGIVSGCMNMIGNLGGAVAGSVTGEILQYYQDQGAVENSGGGMPLGWRVNLLTFGSAYVVATLLWLRIDSTEPVVPEEG